MAYGKEITFSLITIILIPVFMGAIGNTFNEDFTEQQNFTGVVGGILSFFDFITFGFASDLIAGYAIFPIWFNLLITGIPAVLLLRGILST